MVAAFVGSPLITAGGLFLLALIGIKVLPAVIELPPVEVVKNLSQAVEETEDPATMPQIPLPPPSPISSPAVPQLDLLPASLPLVENLLPVKMLTTEASQTLELLEEIAKEEAAELARKAEASRLAEIEQKRQEALEQERLAKQAAARKIREAREAEERVLREREMARQRAAESERSEAESRRRAEVAKRQAEERKQAAAAKRVVTSPVVTRRTNPSYPSAARRSGLEGTTRISATITSAGRVQAPRILSSSGHASLDASALAAVAKWRFTPAKNGLGESIPYQLTIPITFRLN